MRANGDMLSRMGRPSGVTKKPDLFDCIFTAAMAREHRSLITSKIRGQTGLPDTEADRPSAHLRWGVQQMKLRGWTNTDWGSLLEQGDDGGLKVGDGPICMLESVRAPFDAPGQMQYESVEQHYIREAFVVLKFDPIPVYLSEWNDAQAEFSAIELVMTKAIELAEMDERQGRDRFGNLSEDELRQRFKVSKEALDASQESLEDESESV